MAFDRVVLIAMAGVITIGTTAHIMQGPCSTCNCKCDERERKVDCSGLGLHDFPNNSCIPNDTLNLLLNDNELTSIEEDTFARFPSLNNLDVAHNNLSSTIKLPDSLWYFWATHNRIEDISTMFRKTSQMIMMELGDNVIKVISNGTFINCTKTVTLNLSNNEISHVEFGGWYGLYSLTELRLENNYFTELKPSFMYGFTNELHSILFTDSLIKRIQPGTFSKLNRLTLLNLKGNNIQNLTGDAFFPGDSDSRIKTLYLNKNGMKTISPRAFAGLVVIERLYLSGNKLETLPNDLFANVSIKTILDISDNNLKDLPDGFLQSSPNLQELYLYQNKLQIIRRSTLLGLKSLRDLYLFQNNITEIEPMALSETVVANLYLFENALTDIQTQTFQTGNQTIRSVNLYYNKVKYVVDDAFDDFLPGATVYLSCENLREVPRPSTNVSIKLEGSDFDTTLHVEPDIGNDLEMTGFICTTKGWDESTCKLCPVGYYGNRYDPGCTKCPVGGFYQDKRGQSATKPKAIKCEQCNPGTFVPPSFAPGKNFGDCHVCPTGTNKSIHAGFRACPCLDNYFRRDRFGACEPCPSQGLDCSYEFQQLKPGYWWTFNLTENTTINQENLVRYQCFSSNLKIENETYDSRCTHFYGDLPKALPCPGGTVACPVSDDPVNVSCAHGYKGWLCSQCTGHHYSWFEYCLICPPPWHFVLEILAILIMLLVFVAVGIWDYKKRKDGTRSIVDILVARFKIVLGYYQVTGAIFTSLHNIQWPSEISALGDLFRILELNMFKLIAKPSCYFQIFHFDVYQEYLAGIFFYGCVFFLAFVSYLSSVIHFIYLKKHNLQCRPDQLRRTRLKCYLFIILMLFITYLSMCNIIMGLVPAACYTICLDEKDEHCKSRLRGDLSIDCDSSKHKTYAYVAYVSLLYVIGFPLVLLFLLKRSQLRSSLQSNVSRKMHCNPQVQACQNIDDNVDCNGNQNECIVQASRVSGETNSVCASETDTPEQTRSNLDDDENLAQEESTQSDAEPLCHIRDDKMKEDDNKENDYPLYLRFLCENYKSNFWYWEILELTRKVLQTVLVVTFGSEDSLTLGVTIGLSVVFLTSHAYFKPMKHYFEHWLQMISLAAIFFNLLLASMLLIPEPDTGVGVYNQVGMAVFLIGLNSLVILMAVGNTMLMVWRSIKQNNITGSFCNVFCSSCLSAILILSGITRSLNKENPAGRRNQQDTPENDEQLLDVV